MSYHVAIQEEKHFLSYLHMELMLLKSGKNYLDIHTIYASFNQHPTPLPPTFRFSDQNLYTSHVHHNNNVYSFSKNFYEIESTQRSLSEPISYSHPFSIPSVESIVSSQYNLLNNIDSLLPIQSKKNRVNFGKCSVTNQPSAKVLPKPPTIEPVHRTKRKYTKRTHTKSDQSKTTQKIPLSTKTTPNITDVSKRNTNKVKSVDTLQNRPSTESQKSNSVIMESDIVLNTNNLNKDVNTKNSIEICEINNECNLEEVVESTKTEKMNIEENSDIKEFSNNVNEKLVDSSKINKKDDDLNVKDAMDIDTRNTESNDCKKEMVIDYSNNDLNKVVETETFNNKDLSVEVNSNVGKNKGNDQQILNPNTQTVVGIEHPPKADQQILNPNTQTVVSVEHFPKTISENGVEVKDSTIKDKEVFIRIDSSEKAKEEKEAKITDVIPNKQSINTKEYKERKEQEMNNEEPIIESINEQTNDCIKEQTHQPEVIVKTQMEEDNDEEKKLDMKDVVSITKTEQQSTDETIETEPHISITSHTQQKKKKEKKPRRRKLRDRSSLAKTQQFIDTDLDDEIDRRQASKNAAIKIKKKDVNAQLRSVEKDLKQKFKNLSPSQLKAIRAQIKKDLMGQ